MARDAGLGSLTKGMNPRVTTLVLLALLACAPTRAQAQGRPPGGGRPLRVQVQQGLSFGTLLPGVPQTVAPNDPLNAAMVDVRGRGGSDVLVSFLLPMQLDGPAGAGVPVSFPPGSAGYSPTGDIGAQIAFDPYASEVLALPRNGRGMVYLGGIAMPPGQIPSGAYAGTITVTLSYVGN